MPLNGVIATVALEGSQAELNADFVVPAAATNAQVTVHAAIADVVANNGGGKIMVCRPQTPYVQSAPILVTDDKIHLEFEPGTVFNRHTSWGAGVNPYDQPFGLNWLPFGHVSFIGVDDFSCVGFTGDSRTGGSAGNGIECIPRVLAGYYTDDNGKPCRGGKIQDCKIFGINNHSYMFWNVRAQEMLWNNLRAIHGMTDTSSNLSGEGIEIFGGRNVTVSDSYVSGCDGFGLIAWAGCEEFAPADASLDGILFKGNTVEFCRGFKALYSLWDPIAGPQHIRGVTFDHNIGRRIAVTGHYSEVLVRTGVIDLAAVAANPNKFHNILVDGDNCEFLPTQGVIESQMAISDALGGLSRAITLRNFAFGGCDARRVRFNDCIYDGSPAIDASGHVSLFDMPDVHFNNLTMVSDQLTGVAPGINAGQSHGLTMRGGLLRGAMRHGIQVQASDRVTIEGVEVRDWNLASDDSHGVSLEVVNDSNVHNNRFHTAVLDSNSRLVSATGGGARNHRSNNRYIGTGYGHGEWP